MQLNEYMAKHRKEARAGLLDLFPRIVCKDGFSISIQAGFHAYCSPRSNEGNWFELEAGMPSEKPSEQLMQYAENSSRPTHTVYSYVPISVLQAELDSHGGISGDAHE